MNTYFVISLVVDVSHTSFLLQGGGGTTEKVVPSMGWGVMVTAGGICELNLERRVGRSLLGR